MILAISGSLKRSSINSAALRAAARAASRRGIAVTIDDRVRQLPHFDPDLEAAPPASVGRFRAACEAASGVLLAVPEYAFGIPGAFKNALDWTVGSGSLYRKPVTLLNVAPPGRGIHAREALELVLTALDADVTLHSIPLAHGDRAPDGELVNLQIVDQLEAVVAALARRAGSGDAQPLLSRLSEN
jgi:NAD(P)H-dependent FMN reductase